MNIPVVTIQIWHVDDCVRRAGLPERYFTILIQLNRIDENCGGTEVWSKELSRGDLVSGQHFHTCLWSFSPIHIFRISIVAWIFIRLCSHSRWKVQLLFTWKHIIIFLFLQSFLFYRFVVDLVMHLSFPDLFFIGGGVMKGTLIDSSTMLAFHQKQIIIISQLIRNLTLDPFYDLPIHWTSLALSIFIIALQWTPKSLWPRKMKRRNHVSCYRPTCDLIDQMDPSMLYKEFFSYETQSIVTEMYVRLEPFLVCVETRNIFFDIPWWFLGYSVFSYVKCRTLCEMSSIDGI